MSLLFVMVQPGTNQKGEMIVQFLMVLSFKFLFIHCHQAWQSILTIHTINTEQTPKTGLHFSLIYNQ